VGKRRRKLKLEDQERDSRIARKKERERESVCVCINACEMDGTSKKSEAVLIYGCPWVELGRNVPALPSRYTGSGSGAEFLAC